MSNFIVHIQRTKSLQVATKRRCQIENLINGIGNGKTAAADWLMVMVDIGTGTGINVQFI
jgi:hypothetical protein